MNRAEWSDWLEQVLEQRAAAAGSAPVHSPPRWACCLAWRKVWVGAAGRDVMAHGGPGCVMRK
jgi:hypothetical protein